MSANYRGIFRALKEDTYLNIQEVKFYEGLFVEFYIHLLENTDLEAEFYIKQGMTCGQKVFEIACGTGRIGIPMAKAGFDITGVDISGDMLNGYRKNLEKEKAKVRKNVHLYQGDISNFKIDEKYDLIILPATTICLFDDEQIASIFSFADKHLTENGRFIFDRNVIKDEYYNDYECKVKSYIWDDINGHHVSLYQEFLESNKSESVVDIYCININGPEVTRNIGYTRKRVITEEMVETYISNSNFKLYRNVLELQDAGLKFYILEKK